MRQTLPVKETPHASGCVAQQLLVQQLRPGGQGETLAGPTSTLIPCAGLGTSGLLTSAHHIPLPSAVHHPAGVGGPTQPAGRSRGSKSPALGPALGSLSAGGVHAYLPPSCYVGEGLGTRMGWAGSSNAILNQVGCFSGKPLVWCLSTYALSWERGETTKT